MMTIQIILSASKIQPTSIFRLKRSHNGEQNGVYIWDKNAMAICSFGGFSISDGVVGFSCWLIVICARAFRKWLLILDSIWSWVFFFLQKYTWLIALGKSLLDKCVTHSNDNFGSKLSVVRPYIGNAWTIFHSSHNLFAQHCSHYS